MPDGVDLLLDNDAIDREQDRLVRQYLRAGVTAVQVTTRRLEQSIERAVEDAVGGKLWRAVQSSVYPRGSRPARNPAGEIWLKGGARTRGAMQFWTEPGQIRRPSGEWMPVPLPAAGPRNRLGLIDPHVWEASHPAWRLDLLWRDGHKPLLVAHRRATGARGRSRSRGSGGIQEGQPIFALVPFVPFRNAVAIAPLVEAAEGELGEEFISAAQAAG